MAIERIEVIAQHARSKPGRRLAPLPLVDEFLERRHSRGDDEAAILLAQHVAQRLLGLLLRAADRLRAVAALALGPPRLPAQPVDAIAALLDLSLHRCSSISATPPRFLKLRRSFFHVRSSGDMYK